MTEIEVDEKTEFKFSELSDEAKQKARDNFTSDDYPYDEWWDSVYEDANRVAKILGLDIESTRALKSGGTVLDIDISFSGFWSQGDGASFKGSYAFNVDAYQQMKDYCSDDELIRIATTLTAMQIARRLQGLAYFTANIAISGNYSHSGCMRVEVNSEDEDDEHCQISLDEEDQITQLFRDFADWIYKSLETEHDYLCSDEVVDERLAEETFDEDGVSL